MMESNLPVVAIVGRPNVGKSSLFNCLLGRRVAIVHEESGVTRERIMAPVRYGERTFQLVDTGGLGLFPDQKPKDPFNRHIREQVEIVVEAAAVVLWMLDAKVGVTALDREIANFLRRLGCRIVAVVNKADNEAERDAATAEFAELGLADTVVISCAHNHGIGTLLDLCMASLPDAAAAAPEPGLLLAVVGRPNVGKSSVINALLGENRVLVTDTPGTTRDAVDIPLQVRVGPETIALTLIDTAGLRRRRQLDNAVEFFSVARAERAIRRSDAVLFICDAAAPGTAQDRRIARLVVDAGKPCVVAVNKWDLVAYGMKERDLAELVRSKMPLLDYALLESVSARTGTRLQRLLTHLLCIRDQMAVTVPTGVLNRFLQDVMLRTPPPAPGGRPFRFYYATMTGRRPPRFLLFVNAPDACPAHYRRFLASRLREAFFSDGGMPVHIDFRERRASQNSGTRLRPPPDPARLRQQRAIAKRSRQRRRRK